MIKFEHTQVMGFEPALRGMRNPMNSWKKSDSHFCEKGIACDYCDKYESCKKFQLNPAIIGPNDHKLAMSLSRSGPVHRKYLRMINVYVDITAPLYWWKEFDTYKLGVVQNSCSTMHKIAAKKFELDDFSHEHLDINEPGDVPWDLTGTLVVTVNSLNFCREKYLETLHKPMKEESKRLGLAKKWWWQMIQLLPSSYNQKRTVMISYETLANIMQPDCRLHHRLDEWNVDCAGSFCEWVKSLPYSEFITGGDPDGQEG